MSAGPGSGARSGGAKMRPRPLGAHVRLEDGSHGVLLQGEKRAAHGSRRSETHGVASRMRLWRRGVNPASPAPTSGHWRTLAACRDHSSSRLLPCRHAKRSGTNTEQPRRPTYADIVALPEGLNGEILGGELVASPRPASAHIRAASVLGSLLGPPFDLGLGGPGGWWLLHEPELSLPVDPDFDPVIPDLAGWRHETMPEYPLAPPRSVADAIGSMIEAAALGEERA